MVEKSFVNVVHELWDLFLLLPQTFLCDFGQMTNLSVSYFLMFLNKRTLSLLLVRLNQISCVCKVF